MTFDGVRNDVYGDAKYTLLTTKDTKPGPQFDVEIDVINHRYIGSWTIKFTSPDLFCPIWFTIDQNMDEKIQFAIDIFF